MTAAVHELRTTKEAPVARPLTVLAPLIRQDIEQSEKAAEAASLPYRIAAGHKLAEAKSRYWQKMPTGGWKLDPGFWAWVKRNFNIHRRTAERWMDLAREDSADWPWPDPINESGKRETRRDTLGASAQASHRHYNTDLIDDLKDHGSVVKLSLEMLDAGYKALAKKTHPDTRGGSKEGMQRLNAARALAKRCIEITGHKVAS